MSRDLVARTVDAILDRVADGTYALDAALPNEVDLATDLEVSRLTVREAVKILRERGVLRVRQGRGTYLAPQSEWTDLATLIEMTLRTSSEREVGLKLVELRRMVEVGSAGLAARNRSEEDVEELRELIARLDEASTAGDVQHVVDADIAFHRAIMNASGNPFITAIMTPLTQVLRTSRWVTSSHEDVRTRAQTHHREILDAIADGDEERAKDAMRSHMTQTRLDLADHARD
ncbi:FadR family transcriptional regulator [Schaalia sp. 19OD2882]|uniref:FadR/GntR family transcriptional regulator n=1 Tax=Schaalia sp. 19OD2882 TaxID=2794089 RepID=UPI001C1EA743|nr:FadR/GntR family transcriptional regulator [Schaalia sp. 19OD2882]QWW20089.1 FadR family transcriptional regulator [Schaalia sp. 19OD2882]